jgi:SAM-dependent MidA family methyltransferase
VFDDLACRLVAWPDEILVDVDEAGRFLEARRPAAEEILRLVRQSGAVAKPGRRYAVRAQAPRFLGELAKMVTTGRILVVDYGGEGPEVHTGANPLRTFVGGVAGGDPLHAPGAQNITADVDFGALRRAAAELGLEELVYEPEPAWLGRHGGGVPRPPGRSPEDWVLAALLESLEGFRVLLLERAPG